MARELNLNELPEPKTEAEILARSAEYIGQYAGPKEDFAVEIEKTYPNVASAGTQIAKAMAPTLEIQNLMANAIAPIKEMQSQIAKAMAPTLEIQNLMTSALAPIKEMQSQIAKAMAPTLEIQNLMANALAPIREMQDQLARAVAPIKEMQDQLARAVAPIKEMQDQLAYKANSNIRKLDGVIQIKIANQNQVRFAVEVKRALEVRDLPQILRQLEEVSQTVDATLEPMIVARYISKSAQQWLREQQISYADATGNFMVNSPETGTFLLSESGAKQDPWRMPGRPRNTFKGASAIPIFRALIDFSPPYTVPELMKLAKSSSGVTYRVIDFLVREGLLTTEERLDDGKKIRRITNVNWQKLLASWSTEYSFQKDNSVFNFLEPRGIEEVMRKFKSRSPNGYVITGSVAAQQIAPYSISKQITIYSKYPSELSKEMDFRPTQSGANVQIISPYSDAVFERFTTNDGLNYAAPSQIALDLLSGPGRNASEGESLVNWMSNNENRWRKWQ